MARSYMQRGPPMKARHWYLLSLAVIVLDHITKFLATWKLEYGVLVPLLPVLDLTLLHNKGAAFSFLSDAGGWQRWFFTTVALGVSAWIALWLNRLPRDKRWLSASLALILGGAVGNLIDRLWLGSVVDFVDVVLGGWHFWAFNVADSAITVGVVLILWDGFREARAARGAGPRPESR